MTGRVGETSVKFCQIESDLMSSTGYVCFDNDILARLQYGTLGSYDACRWGSAERRWSCEHNLVFHTPPSKFTPYLSLSLSRWCSCENPAQNEQFVPSALKSITYSASQQKMVSGICKKCLKDREKHVNPKERELMSVGRDKKKNKGNILKRI